MDAVILSSADILRILGGDAIIRQEARVISTEGRPSLGIDDTVYVYIEKYPTIKEFEATWRIWVQDNSGMGEYVLNAMTALLPNFDFNGDHWFDYRVRNCRLFVHLLDLTIHVSHRKACSILYPIVKPVIVA